MSILITGATGTVGRPLVRLLAGQAVPIRPVARSVDDLPGGIEVDLSDPGSIVPALDGVDVLFVHPRAVGENADKVLALAAEHGVRRVVVLSAINVDDDPQLQPSRWNGDRNKEVEDAVVAGGLPWVAVRSSTVSGSPLPGRSR